MRIFITIPALNPPHGGLRVIIEWANRLSMWHDVVLYTVKPGRTSWIEILPRVEITSDPMQMRNCDCMIITSPHTIELENHPFAPKKIFIFMQMLEHLFRDDQEWLSKCKQFYLSPHPLMSISGWNIDFLRSDWRRTGPIHYIGNGVNTDHFPISKKEKSGKIVLVEGWEGYNPAKDVNGIGPAVAGRLKKEGFTVFAYGQMRLRSHKDNLTQYFYRPTLEVINWLYETATIMIKASKYDARSCSPVEAMTKGTVTARAILLGDDDLISGFNCLRCGYNEEQLYETAKQLLGSAELRNELATNGFQHLKDNSWDVWMRKINKILTS